MINSLFQKTNRIEWQSKVLLKTFKMAESKINSTKKAFSLDWLMRGVLTRVGETFDKLTGRNWKPSSNLATSELIERLKALLDTEAKQTEGNKWFVPHNIKLKMQWDKFSTDAESSLMKLENELLIAAVDHINDKRYHTFAPLELEIKPDYFTTGVKLLASFDKFGDEKEHEAAINVSVPDLRNIQLNPQPEIPAEPERKIYTIEFTVKDKLKKKELAFVEGQRLSVGRTKENDLWIDDASVSKIHAALVLNSDKQLMVADTGSTNGTFVNNQRIAYGKAIPIKDGDKLKFGTVEVALEHLIKEIEKEEIYPSEQVLFAEPARENLPAREPIFKEENVSAKFDQTIKIEDSVSDKLTTAKGFATKVDAARTEPRIVLDFDENK